MTRLFRYPLHVTLERAQIPAYQVLANRLRDRILQGKYPGGSRLPTEAELCKQHKASRITVRRSLQILEEEKLIQRRQGSGNYVCPQPTRRIPVLDADFSGAVRRHAPELRRTVLDHGVRPPTPEQAEALGLKSDQRVLVARRLDSIGREPVAFDDLAITIDFAQHVNAKLLKTVAFAEAWAEAESLSFGHVNQTIEAVSADDNDAELLRVEAIAPLLLEIATYFSSEGVALGTFATRYRADHFRFQSTTTWK